MSKRLLRLLIGLLVVMIVVGVGYVLLQMRQRGYLPRAVTVTADPAPTAVPLAAAPTTQVAPTATPLPTVTPLPRNEAATATPVGDAESEPASATATATASAPPAPPTRVVPPPEPVKVPPDFGISVFADGLSGPRMMTVGPDGHVYLAERGANRIVRLPDRDGDGVVDGVEVVVENLNSPSSIAFFKDGSLYVGEPSRVLRVTLAGEPAVAAVSDVIVDGLPTGGHNTRTVRFSPDWEWLYVSVGSSCNVCDESDARRAAIVRYRPDGTDETLYAVGLRNAVGIIFRPGTAELWATNNGRDWLGDDQPPETVYLVAQGEDAGWPRCHSGRIIDPEYGNPGDCDGVLAPVVEMQAHTAPLGLGFYTGTVFPEPYRGDLFVALHGSWNRSDPVGYKVVRIPVDDGEPGAAMDFAAGWLRDDGSQWGRPVDVLTAPDGSLLISDDGKGRIYRVFYQGG